MNRGINGHKTTSYVKCSRGKRIKPAQLATLNDIAIKQFIKTIRARGMQYFILYC